MTVVCWTNPVRQRQDGMWAETGRTQPTKLHVTRDGMQTGVPVVLGKFWSDIPDVR